MIFDFTKVPESYIDRLNTTEQKSVARILKAGTSIAEVARMRRVADRNVHAMAQRIRHQLDGMGYKQEPTPEISAVVKKEQITIAEEHRLKAQVKSLQREVRDLRDEVAKSESLIGLLEKASVPNVTPIKRQIRKSKAHQVAATAMLSDTHFDEVVSLAESGGTNQYNREIAERRLAAFAEKTILVARELMSGFEVVHLDMPFGGDMVSGNIHEELARSNDAEIMDTVDHWSERLAEVVVTVAKEFPTVFIPCVVGNHGRNTKKPRHKGRVRDNYDWLIYRSVARIIKQAGVSNVRFDISESTDVLWETMGHKYLLTHGDQASGGAGWGGIFSPIMRLYEKKLKSYASRGQSFDTLMMGHWHQFIDAGPVIVNGSLKGYDEFAHNLNFRAEPPQQAFWLTDPEKGKIFSGPLFVDDHQRSKAA